MSETDYETFVKYVKIKSIIHTGSRIYFYLNNLCQNKDELAEKIFNELEQGSFNKDSAAGVDFCDRYRKHIKNRHSFNEFESRLQAEFPTMKERLDDILSKRPSLQERL